ncbi:MAG: Coenzyme F420 hydrogenase/dehydrogenase, beta subunit C-terminal domain [Acutalibacteraceae bacterium]|jgi:coenzyme F420-reducing hydrogenase beta subunit
MKNIEESASRACSACGACFAVCPTNAVSWNSAGVFLRAQVEQTRCIGCGKCQSVCHRFSQPLAESIYSHRQVFAGASKSEEVLARSTSGGAAYELARAALKNGYFVIGSVYDATEQRAKHRIVQNEQELQALCGSKYIPSDLSEIWSKISPEQKYLVIGTPCQIAGMRAVAKQLHSDGQFVFVDFFCHGNSSVLVWNKYLDYLQEKLGGAPETVQFRCKERGWHTFLLKASSGRAVYYGEGIHDPFYALFLSEASIEKDCFSCRFRFDQIASDIRVGDFWGKKYQQNNKGVSVILAQTDCGMQWLEKLQQEDSMMLQPCDFEELRCLKEGSDHGRKPIPPFCEETMRRLQESGLEAAAKYAVDGQKRNQLKSRIGRVLRRFKVR